MNGCEYEKEERKVNRTIKRRGLFDMKRIRYGPVRCRCFSVSFFHSHIILTYVYVHERSIMAFYLLYDE